MSIAHFDAAHAIKITIPGAKPTSGVPGDRDFYDAQQPGPMIP